MEVEAPWRCRRTDGKKWRCRRNVIPDQKYCDRHMYKGGPRSKKSVEQQQKPLPTFARAAGHSTSLSLANAAAAAAVDSGVPKRPVMARTVSNWSPNHSNVPRGLDFSPNSVIPEEEPGRCRRTDGKKWRCRNGVVSGQKYCETHLHRGANRRRQTPSAAVLPSSSIVSQEVECCSKPAGKADCGNLTAAGSSVATQKTAASSSSSLLVVAQDNVSSSSASSDATISEGLPSHGEW